MLDASDTSPSVDPLLKRGFNFHEAGNNLAAAKIFEIAYRRDPSSIAAILNMGSSYYKAKYYPEAEEAYKEALKTDPDNATAHYGLGMIYEEIRDRSAARARFQRAAALSPDAGKPWMSLAQVTHEETPRLQALKRATDWAKRQLENDALSVEALKELITYFQEAKMHDEVRRACTLALQHKPQSQSLMEALASSHLWLHDYETAANLKRSVIMTCEPTYTRPVKDEAFAKSATKTLIEIHETLTAAKIPFFLVGGTLLGFIRDNGVIPHDKDVDIGVMDDVSNKDVIEAMRNNIEFTCPLTYADDDIYLNVSHGSTGIDVFRHERDNDHIWCGINRRAGAMKWRYRAFGFKQAEILDRTFAVPDDCPQYLTDLFGAWETPDVGYQSVLSSPARFDTDHHFLRYMSYYRLWLAVHRKNTDLLNRTLEQTPEDVRNDSELNERLAFLNQRS